MRSPRLLTAIAGAIIIACSNPTSMCGCPPTRSAVFVVGALLDHNSAPVTDARVYLGGVPDHAQSEPLSIDGLGAATDAAGAFRALVYSMWSPAEMELRGGRARGQQRHRSTERRSGSLPL